MKVDDALVELESIAASSVANPDSGRLKLFVDSVTGNISQKTSSGTVTDLTASGAALLASLTDVNVTGLADKFMLRYDSATSKWVVEKSSFYVNATVSGKPTASFVYYLDMPSGVTVRFKAGLSGSTFKLKTASTSSFVVTIKKGATTIGTATIASSGTSATISFTSDVDFAGDELSFTFPSSQDATASDFKISMIGEIV